MGINGILNEMPRSSIWAEDIKSIIESVFKVKVTYEFKSGDKWISEEKSKELYDELEKKAGRVYGDMSDGQWEKTRRYEIEIAMREGIETCWYEPRETRLTWKEDDKVQVSERDLNGVKWLLEKVAYNLSQGCEDELNYAIFAGGYHVAGFWVSYGS